MDEVMGDEVTALDAVDSTQLRGKERPGSSSVLISHEMSMPSETDCPENSAVLFTNILDGKNLDRIGSAGHAGVSPHCVDDEITVEELTLRNYDDNNLAIVATSKNRERVQTRQRQWEHLYQIAGGSGSGNSLDEASYGGKHQASASIREDSGFTFFSGLLDQNQEKPDGNFNNDIMDSRNNGDNVLSTDAFPPGGIRTKILSKSGFSEYFLKNTLKGKGVICRGPSHRGSDTVLGAQKQSDCADVAVISSRRSVNPSADVHIESRPGSAPYDSENGINMREWLNTSRNKINKFESLNIFRQVVEIVDFAHNQGIALQELRPSCFKLLRSKQVTYVGPSVHSEFTDSDMNQEVPRSAHMRNEKRSLEQNMISLDSHSAKKQKFRSNIASFRRWPQFPSRSGCRLASADVSISSTTGPHDSMNESSGGYNPQIEKQMDRRSNKLQLSGVSQPLLTSVGCLFEEQWYTSPEHSPERGCTFSSNIYCLGVLLFELLGSFNSGKSHAAAMLDLRHRILPPNFLSENPKEAGFCLWLLHPKPSSRPTTREILQWEMINGIEGLSGDELLAINEEDAESELLLHFLLSLKEQKEKDASNLMEQIRCIEVDIEEIERRQTKKSVGPSSLPQQSFVQCGNRFLHRGGSNLDAHSKLAPQCDERRLMNKMRQLENAYFSTRSNIPHAINDMTIDRSRELRYNRDNAEDEKNYNPADFLGSFFDGLCKYARYDKFKLRGVLRNGDFSSSANVICSLSFDRDEDYLATGGVAKKIKIFEFNALLNNSVDIHYPVAEMSNKSKLTCICWNSYIRNYLASTDYDGVVKLWDATTSQGFSHFSEHHERAWCVDFSRVDPTKLVSGSDDCLVKLWSINERKSLCTIRNSANVCGVQFSADFGHLLAYSSADYKTYCYDLRNVSTPWCILAGHEKAVSYVKFLDAETLVSASTDNTLRVWDLNKTSSSGLSTDACVLTLRGHKNEKNFVGLSVADGYIACGSESNEVFAYYKSLPMPITSYKFGSIDPISGKETDDDNGQFVSSVCWRRKSNMVVAANSSGCIKLLEIV